MSTPAARAEDLKILLRGLLISSPRAITVDQLERDFLLQEGHDVPFRKLGYPSFLKYLESIPDTVVIRPSLNGGCPVVSPVISEKSAHIKKMVQRQKVHPAKRASGHCRFNVNATPQMNSAYYSTNYNSNDKQQRLFLPVSLQQRIYKMIHDNPKGVPVQIIEQEFLSGKVLQNYGIPESCDIHYVLSHLGHMLQISGGMVYPLHNETPPYRPLTQNQVTDNKTPNIYNSQTCRFIPAGSEGEVDVFNQSCAVNAVNEFSAERNKDNVAEVHYKQAKVTENVVNSLMSSTRSLTFDTAEVSPDSGSPSDDTNTYICDFAGDLVSKKMRMNFQTLLDKHPNGIWCSELPDLYKKEFAVVLEYANLGFVSVMQMASSLPDVFHCVRADGTDWKLFDAREKLPPEYARYNVKNNAHVSTEMVRTVPRKIGLNIKKLLTLYPPGIPSEQIPLLYKKEFLTTLNVHDLGFCTLEVFLLVLQESNILHVRYVKQKILVYPAAQEIEPEPEEDNPFPHITEPQDHFLNLYPPEVVGPKGTLTHEKIPPEATPGGFIEVLVAEIITPLNFWIQLRGEKTHMALDTLMNDMQQFYEQEAGNYNMPDATVRIGQYCVAPYNEEWHRACVTAVHNFVEVQVMFVDYGTSCRMTKSELRFMHVDFSQFPIQAIKASLANLAPVGGGIKWPREAGVCFLELVEDKNLIAIVSAVDHEARKLEVALVDTMGEEDIHINDVLVRKELAEYKTKRRASPLPPQPNRIDGDPISPTVTVSRPPPGFTAVPELHTQPLISPTGSSAAPGQSKYFPAMPGSSYPQTSLPNIPMANTILSKSTYVPETQGQSHLLISLPNTILSNFIPQPANVLMPSVMYEVPFLANASSLAAQPPVFQHHVPYENLYREQLNSYYTFLLPQNIGAASLVNPFMVPHLNPPVVCIPTPGSERVTNVGQSELDISEVPSCTLPSQKNASGQISPSGTGQVAAAAYVSAEDSASAPATFDTRTETKEPASVMSSGVSHLSVNSSTDLCTADVLCDERPTGEAIASPKEVKGVSPVKNEQQQNKDELVQKTLSNAALTDFSSDCYQSDDVLVADARGLESESHVDFESQYVNNATDLSSSSEYIYRSDDGEDDDDDGGEGLCEQQEQLTLRKSSYVKQIEIAGRVIHLIKILNTIFFCTEEVVQYFTDFSGRHVVLKILDARGVKISFCELGRTYSRAIFDDLETYNIVGVPKSPQGRVIGKVHLTPLKSFTDLIPLLNEEDRQEFHRVMESVTW